jgi:predicted regulator of Ras-like GTPase activity (Roadblock/LC7/MglB family)
MDFRQQEVRLEDEQTLKQQLSRLIISEDQQQELDGLLLGMKDRIAATSVLLIERSGLLLGTYGEEVLNDLSISSLIAGIFKSLTALTALMGEREIQTLAHRGRRNTLLLALLGSGDILAALVAPDADLESIETEMESAVTRLTPLLLAARESTKGTAFSFSKDSISMFLGKL